MVYVILAIVYLVSPMINQEYLKTIDDSILTNMIYKNNVILNIIK